MESSDRDILISITEILTDHIDSQNMVNQQLLRNQMELRAEIKQLNDSVIRNTARLDSTGTYGGWLLAAITLMVTVSTVIVPLITVFISRKEKTSENENASSFTMYQNVNQRK